MSVFHSN